MEDYIDNLQEKCFALLGTINDIKTGDILLSEQSGVNRFNTDLHEMMKSLSIFFNNQNPNK